MNNTLQSFNVFEIIKTSWAKVSGSKSSFWVILAGIIILELISFGLETGITNTHLAVLIALLTTINVVLNIIRLILTWGLAYLGIQRAFDSALRYNMVQYVFDVKLFFKLIGMYILEFIILLPATFLLVLPIAFQSNFNTNPPSFAFTAWTFISITVAAMIILYLLMRLYLTSTIIIAEKIGPWTAIKRSFKATKSHVWQLLGLNIINLLILALCALTAGIGLIWALPYLFICYGVVYKQLVVDKSS